MTGIAKLGGFVLPKTLMLNFISDFSYIIFNLSIFLYNFVIKFFEIKQTEKTGVLLNTKNLLNLTPGNQPKV